MQRVDGYYWVRFDDPARPGCGTRCCTHALAGTWAIAKYVGTGEVHEIYRWTIFSDAEQQHHKISDGDLGEIGPYIGPLTGPR